MPAKTSGSNGISFETAVEIFCDPFIVVEKSVEDDDEQRYQAIGMTGTLVLLLVVFVDRSERDISSSTGHNPIRRVKITDETRRAYEERDKSLDNLDPDASVMPPEFWEGATTGKWYRPIKTQIFTP